MFFVAFLDCVALYLVLVNDFCLSHRKTKETLFQKTTFTFKLGTKKRRVKKFTFYEHEIQEFISERIQFEYNLMSSCETCLIEKETYFRKKYQQYLGFRTFFFEL